MARTLPGVSCGDTTPYSVRHLRGAECCWIVHGDSGGGAGAVGGGAVTVVATTVSVVNMVMVLVEAVAVVVASRRWSAVT